MTEQLRALVALEEVQDMSSVCMAVHHLFVTQTQGILYLLWYTWV